MIGSYTTQSQRHDGLIFEGILSRVSSKHASLGSKAGVNNGPQSLGSTLAKGRTVQ
jgi:hypothetical protein